MGTRCKADVAINMEVYNKLKDTWLGKEKQVMQIECIVAGIHAEQEVYGVKYDVEKAKAFVKMIEEKTDELRKEITEGIPPIVKPGTTVKEPFKNNGELSVRAETWLKDHVNIYSVSHGHHHHYLPSKVGPFSKVQFIPFNLDSGPQVKDYLLSIGWKPQEFNFKKDPVTGKSEITSPKLTEESFGSLPPGLGRMIADYRIMMHRKRLVFSIKKNGGESGALTKVRADGRVPSEALTCGTPTSRYRHSGAVCNIPRPSTLYGPEIRELFTVPSDCLQIGIDLASIEARMMCHYALPYDGGKELAELVLHGDYHQYNADNWDVIRDLAKNGLYALIYGCGEAKLANTLDKPKGSGKKLFDDFWANNQALKYLLDDVNAAVDSGRDIRGLDRRVLSIRQKRKALNSLFQSGAAIVFKHWMRLCEQWIRDWNSKPGSSIHQIIAYHDELQFEITTTSISTATTVGISLSKLAEEAGRILKVKVPITAKYSVGHNWKECH
jgi:DNA polymerase I-like protein with 3'-5' exonuclease and polymerase domains